MSETVSFKLNRAPVLTLWATIVAERLGFDQKEALTLGRAVAGLNAYSKGKRLGLFEPSPEDLARKRSNTAERAFTVDLLGHAVPVVKTPKGIRAVTKGNPSNPAAVEKYLAGKFGEHLAATERAMAELTKAYPPSWLGEIAFHLYESFRPDIPSGVKGWGAAGELSLATIRKAGQA